MSHGFKYRRLSWYDSELKLPSPAVTQGWFARSLLRGWAVVPNRYGAGPLHRGLRIREHAPHVLLLSPPEKRAYHMLFGPDIIMCY
jgi:hypothetical protein